MTPLVIDASVALKWVLRESDSAIAEALLDRQDLIAPDFLQIECANSLWVAARKGLITADQAALGLGKIAAAPVAWRTIAPYAAPAHRIATEIDRTAYDCLYLAVAIAERGSFITADRRFANAAKAHSTYAKFVTLLGA